MSSPTTGKKDAIFALSRNLAGLKYEDIPTQTAELTKMDILDSLGVAIAATSTAPGCKKVSELVKEMGGKKESTIIGYGGKVPSYMAAFVNATLVHALNYDDMHDGLGIHIACSVFPAAFATAERVGKVTGKEFITAYTLGMDIECRLARALIITGKQRDWFIYGWNIPQVLGYFGAAAAAGRLLGLDEEHLVSTFGLAYSQVAGSRQTNISPGSDKAMYPSFPAKAGVLSALMAQKGIAGPKDCLEGKAGLYNLYFRGEYNPALLTGGLGKSFEAVGFYPFPGCAYTQLFVEVTQQMVNEHNIRPHDVEAITVSVGDKTQALCEPLEIRRNPRIMSEAQYSMPFAVATVITKGKPSIKYFAGDGIRDPEILRISNKVNYQPDPECDLQYGTGVCTAKVEIILRDGRVLHSEQKGFRYGHPQRPISKDEIAEKFRDCASYSSRALPNERIEEIIQMVSKLEEVDDAAEIIRLVS